MKKLIYNTILLLLAALSTGSCNRNKDTFDMTAATRIQDQLDLIQKTLTSSKAGWALDYFIPAEQSVPMICDFKTDGTTRISRLMSSKTGSAERYGTVVESAYTIEYGIAPTLSFSTYNSLLHLYSEPINPITGMKDGIGLQGDYEFIVTEVHDDHLVLRGKKHGVVSLLWKLDEETVWSQYLQNNEKMLDLVQEKFISGWRKKDISYEGKSGTLEYNLIMGYRFPDEISRSHEDFNNIVVTDKSFRLQYPLNIDGEEVYEFTYDDVQDEFKALNTNTKIVNVDLKLNEQLHHNARWYIFGEDMCPLYKETWLKGVESGVTVAAQLTTSRVSQGLPSMSVAFLAIFFIARGNFYYDFQPVEGTDDEIKLRYLGSMDSGAAYMYGLNDGSFAKIFNIIGGTGNDAITFKITVVEGTESNPTVLRFTNTANPDHYFNVYSTYKAAYETQTEPEP